MLPAWNRYEGRVFSYIKALESAGHWPDDVDIAIISARYGVLLPGDPIEWYDQIMTLQRVDEIGQSVRTHLGRLIVTSQYSELFILLEPPYDAVLTGLPISGASVQKTISPMSLEALRRWVSREA